MILREAGRRSEDDGLRRCSTNGRERERMTERAFGFLRINEREPKPREPRPHRDSRPLLHASREALPRRPLRRRSDTAGRRDRPRRERRARNLRANDSAAIAVYDSRQRGKPDRGMQLFDSAHEGRGEDAEHAETLDTKRFPDFAEADLSAYRFYLFRPRRLKLFDERHTGGCHVRDRARRSRTAARLGTDRDVPLDCVAEASLSPRNAETAWPQSPGALQQQACALLLAQSHSLTHLMEK
jgi:hypothetical protein